MAYNTFSPIVNNNLVLLLDSINNKSYSGSGLTWYDLTSNSNNGTLVNGPTYDISNGSIVFDGINDYVDCGNNSTLDINKLTISCWFKTTQTSFGTYGAYLISKIGTVRKWTYSLMMMPTGKIQFQKDDGINNPIITTTSSYNDGSWYNVNVSIDGAIRIYINGALVISGSDTTVNSTSNNNSLLIGGNGSNGGYTGVYYNGNISNTTIYNRALSSDEVLQNFNSQKNRYGL